MTFFDLILGITLGFLLGWTGRTAVPLLWEDFKEFIKPAPTNWWDR